MTKLNHFQKDILKEVYSDDDELEILAWSLSDVGGADVSTRYIVQLKKNRPIYHRPCTPHKTATHGLLRYASLGRRMKKHLSEKNEFRYNENLKQSNLRLGSKSVEQRADLTIAVEIQSNFDDGKEVHCQSREHKENENSICFKK